VVPRDELAEEELLSTPSRACFALEPLRLPLQVRHPRAGDRMRPFGMAGSKKLSDLFGEKRVPLREREGKLVFTDGEEVIWVPGVATSEKGRVTDRTRRVVRIDLRAGERVWED